MEGFDVEATSGMERGPDLATVGIDMESSMSLLLRGSDTGRPPTMEGPGAKGDGPPPHVHHLVPDLPTLGGRVRTQGFHGAGCVREATASRANALASMLHRRQGDDRSVTGVDR